MSASPPSEGPGLSSRRPLILILGVAAVLIIVLVNLMDLAALKFLSSSAARCQAAAGVGLGQAGPAEPPRAGGYADPVTPAVVGARFGATGSWARYHTGLDFRAPNRRPIHAVTAGTVVYAGNSGDWAGNHVAVRHADGYTTMYSHMSRIEATSGQVVAAGTVLGLVGETGRAFGPHLHLELYPPGVRPGDVYKAVDPQPWLKRLRSASAPSPGSAGSKKQATVANLTTTATTTQPATASRPDLPGRGRWSGEQRSIAAAFVAVWRQRHLPERALEIIMITGLVESGMTSPDEEHSDRDSAGPLQQRRPYGTEQQRRDPTYAAAKFFDRLVHIPQWQTRPQGDVAQAVQISAYPDRYEKRLADARDLITSVAADATALTSSLQAASCGSEAVTTGDSLSSGSVRSVTDPTSGTTYRIPIPAGPAGIAMNFALDQLGEPYRFGAQGPNSWDCSGLVSKAWKAAGVDVYPQTEQLVKDLPAVATPQPGDLLYHPGHVQMFLTTLPSGKQLVVEAPRTGKDVRVVPQWMHVTRILRPTRA